MLNILQEKFGCERNKKGYKLLPSCIRVIQGDGISYESLGAILENMKKHEWSAENLAFGSGGALLQRMDRDTQKCAYKCSYAIINGNEVRSFLLTFCIKITFISSLCIMYNVYEVCLQVQLRYHQRKWGHKYSVVLKFELRQLLFLLYVFCKRTF